MEWHLRLLAESDVHDCVVVAGYLGLQVQELCDSLASPSVNIRVIHEQEQRGTMAALTLAAQESRADRFLVILGDILMSFPVDHMLGAWRSSGADVAVAVHPSTHPEDSDAAFCRFDGTVTVVPKAQPRDLVPNMSSAGLFAITRAGLQRYGHLRDFGSDVLPAAAKDGELFTYVSSHYYKDTGTPARLETAIADINSGAFACRGQVEPRPALFLDRDGVINPSVPEFYGPENYVLNDRVAQAIRTANITGVPVIVLTNQPHIAKGLMTFDDHERVRARMDRLLAENGAFVDDYFYCPHHPESGFEGEIPELKTACDCRKPAVGLATIAAERHLLDLARSVMVGDTHRDREMARAAGMVYVHVGERDHPDDGGDCYSEAADAIRRGIEVITC
jgi:mannose-1-phosphate guanylyltransferase/phosphomannomutase